MIHTNIVRQRISLQDLQVIHRFMGVMFGTGHY